MSSEQTNERDALILTVRDVDADYHGTGPLALSGAEAALIADAVIAAGWRKPAGGIPEYGLKDDRTGHVTYWGGVNWATEPNSGSFPGYTVVQRAISEWVPVDEKGGAE